MSRLDPETGEYLGDDGSRLKFLPAVPGESPPFELIDPARPDESSADGHTHYTIGSDPAVVDEIVKFYAAQGTPVPAGYADAAAEHAARVAQAG